MRIGILTHHYVKNFGAFMQAYALMSVIKSKYPEAEVEIIDYVVPKHLFNATVHYYGFKPTRGDSIKGLFRKIKLLSTHKKYEKKLPRSPRMVDAESINERGYDLIIVGSDEVWNYNDIAYDSVKFGVGLESKIISYAASVGGSVGTVDIPEDVKNGIRTFKNISVRDEETAKVVEFITGIKPQIVMDPVFLKNFKVKCSDKIKALVDEKPYILIYDCKLTPNQIEKLRKYADDKGLNILGAGEYRKYYDSLDTVNIDPFEWAYLFKNAAYVVTGTFHGTSFSVKYNRKFVSFLTEANRVNKVGYLLTTLGLESHIVMGEDEDNLIEVMEKDIEYTKVNEIIDKKVKESKKYLFESIGDDINSGA